MGPTNRRLIGALAVLALASAGTHAQPPRVIPCGSVPGFYTVTPCRVLDTRTQGGALLASETRVVGIAGLCAIPADASAVSLNVTVVDATTLGEMTGYPPNVPRPNTSTISYPAVNARANNGVLKLAAGQLAFFNNQPSGSAHLLIDVNGYFKE